MDEATSTVTAPTTGSEIEAKAARAIMQGRARHKPPHRGKLVVAGEDIESSGRITFEGRCEGKGNAEFTISVNAEAREVTIQGIRYAWKLFNGLGFGPPGAVLRVVERQDGVVTVKRLREVEKLLDPTTTED